MEIINQKFNLRELPCLSRGPPVPSSLHFQLIKIQNEASVKYIVTITIIIAI